MTEGLVKAENLVITLAIPRATTDVMKQATRWLSQSLYLSTSETLSKAEGYATAHHLNAADLAQLKTAYAKYSREGKSTAEALSLAEVEVLRP